MPKKMDFQTARDLMMEKVVPVGTERIPLEEALLCVLAERVEAAEDVPPFDRSPYDGYAYRAEDTASAARETPVTLRVIEEVPAGAVPTQTVISGTAVKILTGAPIPQGADTVCKYEDTVFTPDSVTLFAKSRAGQNIVTAGEDVRRGDLLAEPGIRIDAGLAGTLAAQGIARPAVYRRLRVGLISTGNEVIGADAPAEPGKIRNSSRYMLSAALMQAGMEPVFLGMAGDETARIAKCIAEGAAHCDAVLLTGGVSAGDYDLTPDAMEQAGVTLYVRGVDLKPGMACAYGMAGEIPVCGLSGNPAAALTNFYCIALPILKKRAGYARCIPQMTEITLKNGFRKKSGGTRILRGRLDLTDGTVGMIVPEGQGNAVLSDTIGCDAAAIVPAGSGPLPAGTVLKGFVL